MIIREITCKSLLNKSKLADYCINCYVGCGHGCLYCYSDYITRKITDHNEKWGEFIDVKINAPKILKKELEKKSRGSVFISSLCDCYQPVEKNYELTRQCLEILLEKQYPVIIQTKSSLVLRDLELIKKFKEIEVGFTFTTLDESVRKDFEPNSSKIEERLNAVKILKENGINVYIFFGPMLPYISDRNLEEYFQTFKSLGISDIWIDKMNVKPGLWQSLFPVLESKYPDLVSKWHDVLFHNRKYWEELKKRIKNICLEKKLNCIFCF